MRRLGHVPALDGVRGIAILLVLVHHVSQRGFVGGAMGVDLFFVLSGFLITSLLLNEWERAGTISLSAFYRRRGLRLLPALLLVLATCILVTALLQSMGKHLLRPTLLSALFGMTYVMNFVDAYGHVPWIGLAHLWSLAQEEQFYLLWPPLLVLLLRLRVPPRPLMFGLAGLALAAIAYRQLLLSEGLSGYRQLSPDARMAGILLGCCAGVAFVYHLVTIPRWLPVALLTPFVLSVAVRPQQYVERGPQAAVFTICSAILVLALATHSDWWAHRLFSFSPLRSLGVISYGVYLWHAPLYHAFGWQLGAPLAITIAWLSYRYVEKPFLRLKLKRGQTAKRPAPVPATAGAGG